MEELVPRDDLAFALMQVRRIEQIAAAPPHQEFRATRPDRVMTPAPRGGLARSVFRQLRKREDLAPHLPGGRDLFAIGAYAQGNGQGWIAMGKHEHLRVVDAAQRNAEEIGDANIDRHPHAVEGTAHDDAFAMKFDLPHAAIGTDVVRGEADGQ